MCHYGRLIINRQLIVVLSLVDMAALSLGDDAEADQDTLGPLPHQPPHWLPPGGTVPYQQAPVTTGYTSFDSQSYTSFGGTSIGSGSGGRLI